MEKGSFLGENIVLFRVKHAQQEVKKKQSDLKKTEDSYKKDEACLDAVKKNITKLEVCCKDNTVYFFYVSFQLIIQYN